MFKDSNLTLEQALAQNPELLCPQEIIESLGLMEVKYHSFDKELHIGQIVVARSAMTEVEAFFDLAYELKFPINKVIPAAAYGWDDERLMAENITSGFNYRNIAGSKQVSQHAFGLAFDVNTVQNPYIRIEGEKVIIKPSGGEWDKNKAGTLFADHPLVMLMKGFGWGWGGDWTRESGRIDYQHFEKV